ACYRDPVSVGPVYFDYVRLFAKDDAASDERLFKAAYRKPPVLTRGSVEAKKVPVKVAGAAGWPVRCSLPIPRGELASAANATVLDQKGAPLPTQNRALAVWPDGSVKWLYLDFFNAGDSRYTVAYGNAIHPLAPTAKVQ